MQQQIDEFQQSKNHTIEKLHEEVIALKKCLAKVKDAKQREKARSMKLMWQRSHGIPCVKRTSIVSNESIKSAITAFIDTQTALKLLKVSHLFRKSIRLTHFKECVKLAKLSFEKEFEEKRQEVQKCSEVVLFKHKT